MTAKVLSVCVSKPKIVEWRDELVSTGIFKLPVEGVVKVSKTNLQGDQQADLTVHGGPDKAVYGYPSEHYAYWKDQLPHRDLPMGMFGENLTTQGLSEENLCIGDKLQIGSAVLVVTQPRLPCFKLGIKFGDEKIIRQFYKSGRWGFYFSVLEEGELAAGDEIKSIGQDGLKVKVTDVIRVLLDRSVSREDIVRVLESNVAAQIKPELKRLLGSA